MIWVIRNKELDVILPLPYHYHTKSEAVMAMEELISFGKDLDTREDLARKLEVIPQYPERKK